MPCFEGPQRSTVLWRSHSSYCTWHRPIEFDNLPEPGILIAELARQYLIEVSPGSFGDATHLLQQVGGVFFNSRKKVSFCVETVKESLRFETGI